VSASAHQQLAIVATPLSAGEARALTDEVKADAAALWRKLLRLYEGQAHVALGYGSWGEYCREEFDIGRSRAYQLLDAGRVAEALAGESTNCGTDRFAVIDNSVVRVERTGGAPVNEAQARELAPLLDTPDELVDVMRDLRAEHGARLTAEKVRLAVAERMRREHTLTAGVLASTGVEWYTPAQYVDAAREVLGGIDLDPASCDQANRTVRARTYYTAQDDGLEHYWHGRVWLNPPYGKSSALFVGKLLAERAAGRVDAAIVLLNGLRVRRALVPAALGVHALLHRPSDRVLVAGPEIGRPDVRQRVRLPRPRPRAVQARVPPFRPGRRRARRGRRVSGPALERYVTAGELAELMGVSTSTVKRMVAAGMPSETWGMSRTRRFLPSQAMSWASAQGRIRDQPDRRANAVRASQRKE
jgi:hypothetical protein